MLPGAGAAEDGVDVAAVVSGTGGGITKRWKRNSTMNDSVMAIKTLRSIL